MKMQNLKFQVLTVKDLDYKTRLKTLFQSPRRRERWQNWLRIYNWVRSKSQPTFQRGLCSNFECHHSLLSHKIVYVNPEIQLSKVTSSRLIHKGCDSTFELRHPLFSCKTAKKPNHLSKNDFQVSRSSTTLFFI